MGRAEEYLTRALKMRRLAETVVDKSTARALAELAEQYVELAAGAAQRENTRKPMKGMD
jgi:HEPN domain-containing protein